MQLSLHKALKKSDNLEKQKCIFNQDTFPFPGNYVIKNVKNQRQLIECSLYTPISLFFNTKFSPCFYNNFLLQQMRLFLFYIDEKTNSRVVFPPCSTGHRAVGPCCVQVRAAGLLQSLKVSKLGGREQQRTRVLVCLSTTFSIRVLETHIQQTFCLLCSRPCSHSDLVPLRQHSYKWIEQTVFLVNKLNLENVHSFTDLRMPCIMKIPRPVVKSPDIQRGFWHKYRIDCEAAMTLAYPLTELK